MYTLGPTYKLYVLTRKRQKGTQQNKDRHNLN